MKKLFLQFHFRHLVLPLMLLCSIPSHSQSYILASNQGSEISIIRNYKNKVDITYNLYCSDISFNYVDRSSMTIRSASLPSNIQINDFVVYDEYVYFCGRESVGYISYAIYGYFDIQSLFFGSGGITYFETDQRYIETLQKIDAKQTSSGDIHMVMIGTGPLSKSGTCSLIADAWIDATGNNTFKYTFENSETCQFNDVALTEKYAVVTATCMANSIPNQHHVLYYKEPTSPGNSYLDCWTPNQTPLWQADPATFTATQPILITKIKQDGFATVCNSSLSNKIVVSIFNNPTNPPAKRFVLPYNDFFQEIVFNPNKETLFILEGWYSSLEYTKSPFVTTSKVITNSGERWLSIDNTDLDNSEIIYGFKKPISKYWHFDDLNPTICAVYENNDNYGLPINERNLGLQQTIYTLPLIPQPMPIQIQMFNLTVDCE